MPARPTLSPVWLVLTGILSVQFGAAVAKQLFDQIDPTAMVWLRLVTSAVVLVALARPALRGRTRLDWGVAVAFGLSLGLMNWAFYQSFARIPLGIAVTIEFVGPLTLAVIMSRRARDLLWVGLAAAGVAVLGLEPGSMNGAGVAFALLAGGAWAAYILLSARTGSRWPGLDGLAVASVVATLVITPFAVRAGGSDLLDPRVLALGAAVGLLSSVIPYSLELIALRTIPPRVFSILMSLEPAAAALAGVIVLAGAVEPAPAPGHGLRGRGQHRRDAVCAADRAGPGLSLDPRCAGAGCSRKRHDGVPRVVAPVGVGGPCRAPPLGSRRPPPPSPGDLMLARLAPFLPPLAALDRWAVRAHQDAATTPARPPPWPRGDRSSAPRSSVTSGHVGEACRARLTRSTREPVVPGPCGPLRHNRRMSSQPDAPPGPRPGDPHARLAASPRMVLGYADVLSDDGTRLRAWTNDPRGEIDGPTVLLCNGLGVSQWAWPALLDPACGVRVVSWNHRGVAGSDRPADPERVGVEELVEDALSVLDHFGLDRVVVLGWSIGVNTAFELATRHPERVAGIFAVAGVPGDTFRTMLAPLRVPHVVARPLTLTIARGMRHARPGARPLIAGGSPSAGGRSRCSTHSGFMLPCPTAQLALMAVHEFLTTPVDWYFHLAAPHLPAPPGLASALELPVLLVGATYDVLTGARDLRTAADGSRRASTSSCAGTHFVQMEQPERVHALLHDFLGRVG